MLLFQKDILENEKSLGIIHQNTTTNYPSNNREVIIINRETGNAHAGNQKAGKKDKFK